jgi:hypothetical protein
MSGATCRAPQRVNLGDPGWEKVVSIGQKNTTSCYGFRVPTWKSRAFWGSFKVLRFVDVLVIGSKHCKLQRMSLRYSSTGNFGTVLGKRKNARRRR